MYQFTLKLEDNPRLQDPRIGFFKAINEAHPELGLDESKAIIKSIMNAASLERPNRAIVTIQKSKETPDDYYTFFYDRFNINKFIKNPYFTKEELNVVTQFTNSEELLNYIAVKANLNFNADEFFTNPSTIRYAGGSVYPNFYLESVIYSLWWTGSMVLWLHSGGDTPDPVDPYDFPVQFFPELTVMPDADGVVDLRNRKDILGKTVTIWNNPEYESYSEVMIRMPQFTSSDVGIKIGSEFRIANASTYQTTRLSQGEVDTNYYGLKGPQYYLDSGCYNKYVLTEIGQYLFWSATGTLE